MRKLLIAATILVPLSAHADFNSEADLQDMQDDFELRQMGLDPASRRMERLEQELYLLRMQVEQDRYLRSLQPPPTFDPSTAKSTGEDQ